MLSVLQELVLFVLQMRGQVICLSSQSCDTKVSVEVWLVPEPLRWEVFLQRLGQVSQNRDKQEPWWEVLGR